VTVLEKEGRVGAHQSSHNSGVLHSGVYYTPGGLRARTCVEGARLMEDFCDTHGVALEHRGKLIVAVERGELGRLDDLHARGVANGVRGLELIDGDAITQVEPHVRGLRALRIPGAAVVDYSQVTDALAADVQQRGGDVRCGVAVDAIHNREGGAEVITAAEAFTATAVIVCAGLWSDRLAVSAGAPRHPRIVPFRGDFWQLRPQRTELVRGLVYPVPDPRVPFLGVHATRRIDGTVWLGPSAVLALSREGYRRGARSRSHIADLAGDAAVWRMLARHWRSGVTELVRDRSRRLLVRAAQRYIPELRRDDLTPGPCGIRAQAVDARGRLLDDFATWRDGAVICVRNAPSPAATASLAIARLVADLLEA
jgi:L-2-hydroxyglutarate oxidase LhgO